MNPSFATPYPPHRAILSAQARTADRRATLEFGLPSLVLMEHAARGLAELVLAVRGKDRGPIGIVCGPGQNGGDGLGCARFLRSFGVDVRVARVAPRPPSGDAAIEFAALVREVPIASLVTEVDVENWSAQHLGSATVVVDALFGIGLDRDLDAPARLAVLAIDSARCPKVAVDVPSGIDSDTGAPRPIAVHADVTAAMGFAKLGTTTLVGAAHAGRVVEIDIGLPAAIHELFLVR